MLRPATCLYAARALRDFGDGFVTILMAVVTPPERPAAASITSVPRSLAAAASPAFAGALFATGFEASPFVICGGLKILYDLALLWTFRHVRPPEELANP
jgi:hypothetical protein